MTLHIRKFDIAAQLKPHRTILIIGKRGTGKTTLLRCLMSQMHELGQVHLPIGMSPTEESMEMMREVMPAACVHRGMNTAAIGNIIHHQRAVARAEANGGEPREHILLCCDDCSYDKQALRTVEIRDLFMNGRHLKLAFILAQQYLVDLPPDLRANCDYVFALRDSIKDNVQKLHKMFFGCFSSYADFDTTFRTLTDNWGCIVLDNTTKSSKLEDQVFWFKADPDLPPFRLGRARYHQLSNIYSKSDAQREQEESLHSKKTTAVTYVEKTDH